MGVKKQKKNSNPLNWETSLGFFFLPWRIVAPDLILAVNVNFMLIFTGSPLIGIRIPDYPFIREVCRQVSTPLALTSANISSTGWVSVLLSRLEDILGSPLTKMKILQSRRYLMSVQVFPGFGQSL